MMYPRLLLLKQFLTEDGAIFVSIDDNEVAGLRVLMDERFVFFSAACLRGPLPEVWLAFVQRFDDSHWQSGMAMVGSNPWRRR